MSLLSEPAVQQTGSQANTGRYYADSYQLAVDTINAKGGIKVGDKTYKLALKLYDNQSDPSLAVRQYTQLLTSDKVNFLLGPFASNYVLDTSSVAEKYQVPMVEGGGASGQIFCPRLQICLRHPAAGRRLLFASTIEMLGKLDPKPTTAALVAADDSFDVSVAKGTRAIFSRTPGSILSSTRSSPTATASFLRSCASSSRRIRT